MITPFNSADTVHPKQVSESHQRYPEAYKYFLAHSKAKYDVFLKASFDAKHAIFEENNSKHKKSTTYGRLRTPKSFEMSYDHAKHFVEQLMTSEILHILVSKFIDALNARKLQFRMKFDFQNS